jgi:hypothetical protein
VILRVGVCLSCCRGLCVQCQIKVKSQYHINENSVRSNSKFKIQNSKFKFVFKIQKLSIFSPIQLFCEIRYGYLLHSLAPLFHGPCQTNFDLNNKLWNTLSSFLDIVKKFNFRQASFYFSCKFTSLFVLKRLDSLAVSIVRQ